MQGEAGMELVGYTMTVCTWVVYPRNSDLQLVHVVIRATFGGVSATSLLTFWYYFKEKQQILGFFGKNKS